MISESFWLWQFLGRLHPMVVHFPIALLLFGALLELFTIDKFQSKLRPGINLMVMAGAASVLIAAVFGLLLANNEAVEGDLFDIHRWLGIGSAIFSVAVLYFLNQVGKKNQTAKIKAYRTVLFIAAFGVGISGHFGASLTHGEDFLTETFPWNNSNTYDSGSFDLAAYESGASGLSPEKEMQLIGEVRTVLAHNCYKCHSGAKTEGELRLDEREFVFQGGESGAVISPGNPDESELFRRISLPKNHKDAMPSKGKHLSKEEIDLIGFWIAKGAPWPDGAEQKSVYRVAELASRKPALPPATAGLENPVDLWVNTYFEENDLTWQAPVDDRTYLRRIYLDVVGLVPSPEELASFTKDSNPDKRAVWLRKLLDKNNDYATHWLTFWNDALRNDYTGTGYITNGRYNITDWLYKSLQSNKPYDVFVKELLNPTDASKGFIEGIRWRGTVNASQRTEMQAAQNVGQVILGLNLKCASCHDSFISDWKLEEAYAFANIFADSTLEVSRCEKPIGKLASTKILWEELGEMDSSATRAEKLRQLSEYLVQPANGRMYRTIVNRIWKQMMGRGMVEPVDEMDNEPWSQDLLDWLASDFVENNYDLKELIFLIGTSKIYQSPSFGVKSPDIFLADDYVFAGMVRRRMTAEQFSDAVSQVFSPVFEEKDLKYNPSQLLTEQSSNITYTRASLVANNSFLTALGRPNREIVSTNRDSQASLLQALELTNGERLNTVLQKGAAQWKEKYQNGPTIIAEVYNKALLRKPTKKESEIALAALGNSPDVGQIQDFFWAIVLLPEFQLIY
ncbi:PSD1 and planctomycete cytochrome C domain-containing protein [Aquiflexum sp. TKW24L]|uniref:PSD1 and planctomycete cytochrome C domain-containing protein n=1 Tax=Aquiflexum sp. TKW24L TaxID=2942212 RepID=UPI0020C0747A|nr:PSD1 and planctomycete cytochrome C domain-containing protein [Aquiflexum sp. TKW24L]MCL6259580.1 PSD1 and planctomycete cytochrome C domain-containing protein [Aquiflexum sp. TKW24L]